MNHRNRWLALAAILAIAAPSLSACKDTDEAEPPEPAKVEEVKGAAPRVTLTEEGIRLVGIRTVAVRPDRGGGSHTTIPYGAVVYDPAGKTYAFTEPGPRTFQRAPITVEEIDGNRASLSDGPPAGTKVVTVGASELYGAETGVEE